MDRTCVSTGRSPETSGPSSPECTTPTLRPSRGNPPRTGVLRARYSGRRASRDGSSSLLESAATPSTLGRVESAPLMAASSAGQHRYIAAIDEKPGGPRRSARASRVPHSVSRIATRQLESRVREAQGRVILLSGAGSQPSCGRRDRL